MRYYLQINIGNLRLLCCYGADMEMSLTITITRHAIVVIGD